MIKFNDLNFSYRRGEKVFANLTSQFKQGHIYGLLGKNGTGKSTLLKLISGLVFPDNGIIDAFGFNPIKREPGYLSDLFFLTEEVLLPNSSMRSYARFAAPFYSKFNHDELERYMKEFEVSMDTKLNKLSFGQKKKAMISFALACNTKVLIMDEPTNALDIPAKSQFRRIVSTIATEDRYIIISTHQVRDLDNLIDALFVIDEKGLLVNETIDNISKKLLFTKVEDDDNVLYYENSIRGNWGIVPNINSLESGVDIELFFNALLSDSNKIKSYLQKD